MTREQKFFSALRDVFVGAKVEGESGYINLMRIKSRYYEAGVFPKLQEDINEALKQFPAFRDELFEKLYDFFHRYFSESGSIYFRHTPLHQNVYEKVYTNDKDVMLFWKTHMLYYVKTDRLFRSLEVELDGQKFFLDVSTLEHKKANEKRDIVYSFKEKRKDTLVFEVAYSERGRKTSVDDILRILRKQGVTISEDALERAFRIFEKQSKVDYFINKDAKAFLEEQFNLWLYQYVFSGVSEWTEIRIKQLQTLKDIAFKIIAFISQFENELVKIWNKPKFVLNSNYVITLDRIAENDIALVEKLLAHKNLKAQIEEWQQLDIVDGSFKKAAVLEKNGKGKRLAKSYQYLPIDTKHFKDVELEVLALFDNIDEALDGRLIKSENYQALNTLKLKHHERVKLFYNDPPYNTGQDEFIYEDSFQSATWLTMMKDRVQLCQRLLSNRGSFAISIDENEVSHCLRLLDDTFTRACRAAVASVKRGSVTGHKAINPGLVNVTEYVPIYAADRTKWNPNRLYRPRERNDRYNSFIRNRNEHHEKWEFCSLLDAFSEYKAIAKNRLRKELGLDFEEEIFRFICDNRDAVIQFARPDADKVSEEVRKAIDKSKKQPSRVVHVPRAEESDFYLLDGERIIFYTDRLREVDGKLVTVEPMSDIWDDVVPNDLHNEGGVELKKGKKPEKLLHRIIELCTRPKDVVADAFLGSGTSVCVAQKSGRKWLGIELGDHFDTKALVRMKKVLAGDHSGVSGSCRWAGGGFFKYFSLEQYEDTLRRAKYDDADLFDDPNTDPYHQYVFLRDLKMLEALKVDTKKSKVKVDLGKLYDGIDIAETLSNLTGKWIKRITADSVEFDDGDLVDIQNLAWKRIKPLIWW